MRADSSIRKIATQKNDSKILALVSRELVAAEACYTGHATGVTLDQKQAVV